MVFPLLADPEGYRACDTDLLLDDAARAYWLELFGSQIEVALEAAATVGYSPDAIDGVRKEFQAELDLIRQQPDRHGRLDILLFDEIRQQCLNRHGIVDEFRLIKDQENEAALRLLPQHLEQLDALEEGARFEKIIRSMLAGNLFDMGVKATSDAYGEGEVSFRKVRDLVPKRPWLGDDLGKMQVEWLSRRKIKAVIFADNAGADLILGILPLAREILQRGGTAVIAANDGPALNDITAEEIRENILPRAKEMDPIFDSVLLRVVGNGHHAPLLDLLRVSKELAEQARGANLVVLVGMGRSIESNRTTRFTCPCWKIGMVKDPQVARGVGGKVFDAMVRQERAAE